jgi:hypothetical protein
MRIEMNQILNVSDKLANIFLNRFLRQWIILRRLSHPVHHSAPRNSWLSKVQRQMGSGVDLNLSLLGTGMAINCQRDCDERHDVKKELPALFQA